MSQKDQFLPLVVVGGWGVNAAMLRPVVKDWPTSVQYQSLSDELLADCDSISEVAARLVGRYPEPAIWVGWSQGAQVIMAAAGLKETPLEAAVTVAGFPCFVESDRWPSGMERDRFQAFQKGLSSDARRTWRRFQQLLVHGCADAGRSEARRALLSWVEDGPTASETQLAKSLNWLAQEDQRELWSRLSVPALHLLGGADALVSSWQNHLPLPVSSECRELAGMTHWPFGRHAGECKQAITEFVASMTDRQEVV